MMYIGTDNISLEHTYLISNLSLFLFSLQSKLESHIVTTTLEGKLKIIFTVVSQINIF